MRQLKPTAPLLLRMDSAHDAKANRHWLVQQEHTDFIIKWNRRKENPEQWYQLSQEKHRNGQLQWQIIREGKRIAQWSEYSQVQGKTLRRLIRLTERTIDKHGQQLVLPEYTLEGWWTSLDKQISDEQLIELYQEHGTSEQFHSEIKSDLDLERLS